MSLKKLSMSYRCHNAIGNSLVLKEMMSEVIKTFVLETEAIHGSFYLLKENNYNKNIVSIGKNIPFDINTVEDNLKNSDYLLDSFNEKIKLLMYKLENGFMFFAYDSSNDINSIISIFDSLKNRLNISINSCLNVEILQEKNHQLEKQKNELEVLTQNLQNEVNSATKLNIQKEKQIFEQLKMAQMGELIGNIAHQWRQPLSVISTAASGMKVKKELNMLSDIDFLNYANSIVENSSYLSKTIDEFRDYIKDSNREKEIVIQNRLKMALSLVASSFTHENIKIIEGFIEKEAVNFRLVLGNLLQVLISILDNAKDALVGNKIEDRWIKYELYKTENKVLITFEDNAGGISDEIIDKIFNPYFTTKHQSQGTGIGLYTSYDIVVNKLGGMLSVKNTKNGAKFFIELPLNLNYVI